MQASQTKTTLCQISLFFSPEKTYGNSSKEEKKNSKMSKFLQQTECKGEIFVEEIRLSLKRFYVNLMILMLILFVFYIHCLVISLCNIQENRDICTADEKKAPLKSKHLFFVINITVYDVLYKSIDLHSHWRFHLSSVLLANICMRTCKI